MNITSVKEKKHKQTLNKCHDRLVLVMSLSEFLFPCCVTWLVELLALVYESDYFYLVKDF